MDPLLYYILDHTVPLIIVHIALGKRTVHSTSADSLRLQGFHYDIAVGACIDACYKKLYSRREIRPVSRAERKSERFSCIEISPDSPPRSAIIAPPM